MLRVGFNRLGGGLTANRGKKGIPEAVTVVLAVVLVGQDYRRGRGRPFRT